MADNFNPFQGVGQSFTAGAQIGQEYAKTKIDVEMRQAQMAQKQQELEQVKRQRDLDTGKWFMDQVEKIGSKPSGKYKNTLIQNFQGGLAQIGYKNTDALASMLTDENYANDMTTAIANYHQMTPEMQQQWLPEISKFINSGDPAEQLKAFAAQSGEIERLKMGKDLDLRNKLLEQKNEKELQKPKPSVGQQSLDRTFGKEYDQWTSTGRSAVESNIAKLQGVVQALNEAHGNTSGRLVGRLPDWLRSEESITLRDDVRSAVTNTLKETLGAQFTEREGERVFNLAYNEKLSPDKNIVKVTRVLDMLVNARDAREQKVQYFETHDGSLAGFKSQPAPKVDEPTAPKAGAPSAAANPVAQKYSPEVLAGLAKLKAKKYDRKKIENILGAPLPDDLASQFGLK